MSVDRFRQNSWICGKSSYLQEKENIANKYNYLSEPIYIRDRYESLAASFSYNGYDYKVVLDEEYADYFEDTTEKDKSGQVKFKSVNHSERSEANEVESDGEIATYANYALEYFGHRCALSGEKLVVFDNPLVHYIVLVLSIVLHITIHQQLH